MSKPTKTTKPSAKPASKPRKEEPRNPKPAASKPTTSTRRPLPRQESLKPPTKDEESRKKKLPATSSIKQVKPPVRQVEKKKPVPPRVASTVKSRPTGIMTPVHNVTVSSPPPQRKISPVEEEDVEVERPVTPVARKLERPRTSTLAPKDIVLLKQPQPRPEPVEVVKKPVAFEVSFVTPKTESDDYEDDFESYESDFETGSSSSVSASSESESASESEESSSDGESHVPVTVIHKEKEDDRKLDSGHYELHARKPTPPALDSIDTSMDSGFSHGGHTLPKSATYGGSRNFCRRGNFSKRGMELMQKVKLDTIAFDLFEAKPIAYEHFMRVYGSGNSVQAATQTNENRSCADTQTDDCAVRSVWTQQHLSGELADPLEAEAPVDVFERSLREISKFHRNHRQLDARGQHVDFERLNAFLNSTSLVVSRIVSAKLRSEKPDAFQLQTNLLSALRVVRVFANPSHNLIITVHASKDGVYQSDFANLLMVWNTTTPDKPVRLLSSWSEVTRAEVCAQSADIVVGGLKDGSVAMWDLKETHSFCSKLDGCLTHFAATQSIAPSWGGAGMDIGAVVDVKGFREGLKAFLGSAAKTVQLSSLHETGLLTTWTLVETTSPSQPSQPPQPFKKSPTSKFEYTSPWARVKLIQSAICDLREYLELDRIRPKSAFDMKRSNFEKQLFSDDVLKELNETQSASARRCQQGMRFTNMDAGSDHLFVGTNRNLVLVCSKMLNADRFRKIVLNHRQFLFPTALRLLPREDFLAVGLSNGSVMLVNCDPSKKVEELHTQQDVAAAKPPQLEMQKSCAIQNIIRSERSSFDSEPEEDEDSKPKPRTVRMFDKHVILGGHVLRKHLVQRIEVSQDGRTLFALSDGQLRRYDFLMEKETASWLVDERISEVALCGRHMAALGEDELVKVHFLK